jgi:hypothetical protein
MANSLADFSTDLRRISYWLYDGRTKLAKESLARCKKLFAAINPKIGCFENIWDEIDLISSLKEGRKKAAERALTLSRILYFKSQTGSNPN